MGTKQYDSATDLLTFSRASGGTALTKISYGNNLVTNGTFDTDLSGWTTDTEWVYSNGKAALLANAQPNRSLSSTNAYVEAGKAYRVRFDASTSVGTPVNTSMKLRIWGNDNGTGSFLYNGNYILTGSHERLISPTANGYVSFDNVVSSSFDKFIDNVSIEEVLFGQSDGTLQVYNHPNNIPRIEYDATGAVKGLLIEEARTNLQVQSGDFSNSAWSASGAVTVDASYVAPDGSSTASKLTSNGASGASGVYDSNFQGTGMSLTCFMKAGSSGVYGWIEGIVGGTSPNATFDLENGTVVRSRECDASIESVGNGWFRCVVANTTSSVSFFSVGGSDDADSSPWGFSSLTQGKFIYAWGAQLETGAFPTSYIPTKGAPATRAIDIAEIPTSAFGYNNDAGSISVEFKSNKPSSLDYGAFVLSDGGVSNRILHFTSSTATDHRVASINSNTIGVNIGVGSRGAPSELVKFAVGFSDNNFAASLNGATAVTDTSVTIPSGLSRLGLGFYYPTNLQSNLLNGHIKSIQYYPRRLTNTQLQELTT